MQYSDRLFNKRQLQNEPASSSAQPLTGDWARLRRFLHLGHEMGVYVAGNAVPADVRIVMRCLADDGLRTVDAIVDATGQEPALVALAMAASPTHADALTNRAALAALPLVVRTASQLCQFAGHSERVRGWGRALRSAIADWYAMKPVSELAAGMLKKERRGAWSNRDVLRAAHPKARTPEHNALFRWVIDGELGSLAPESLRLIYGFELARQAATESEVVRLIEDYRLGIEMIPPAWTKSARVWEALLPSMAYAAMLRNLGRMTDCGLLAPRSEGAALAVARIIDRHRIRSAKIHPISLLAMSRIYSRGRSELGGLRWQPVSNVADALDEAFHVSFDNVVATGERVYVWIESDQWSDALRCHGLTSLPVAKAAAALALAFERAESNHTTSTGNDPFEDALRRGLEVDAFVLLTSFGAGETALGIERYRLATGLESRLAVLALSAEEAQGADHALTLDVAGLDASVPAVLNRFLTAAL